MKPHEKHRSEATGRLSFRVVTVSSSRYQKKSEGKKFEDESGDLAGTLIVQAGFSVSSRSLLPDHRRLIGKAVKEFLGSKDDVLLFTGGTGVAPSDVTIEAARPFFEKELDGFGELLRRKGYDEIGAAALLTRATAGVSKGKLILCLPGSPGAVRTALESTIGELPHVLHVARQ
jgi:molybdenum cofactor biosynthesis protein B